MVKLLKQKKPNPNRQAKVQGKTLRQKFSNDISFHSQIILKT